MEMLNRKKLIKINNNTRVVQNCN